ncbi:hypothetical protein MU1_23740 [Paenibacillus glycanilyticus]|uniref:Uncharacterized protein n=1 Tax=Paenibacillus glycanilyticus TaxID=126569 RepID=A0ABQ6GAM4_9BACL|nr:hypothetical protein MU1_23740 [Paenibacillus glycanilyticus]
MQDNHGLCATFVHLICINFKRVYFAQGDGREMVFIKILSFAGAIALSIYVYYLYDKAFKGKNEKPKK